MPMQYPPLANGAYRVGDEPRPLPSPVPGPDPDAAWTPSTAWAPSMEEGPGASPTLQPGRSPGDPAGRSPGSPHDPQQHHQQPFPPGQEASGSGRPKGQLAAAAIVGGLGIVVAFLGAGVLGLGAGGGPGDTPRGPTLPGAGQLPNGLTDLAPGEPFAVDGTFTVVSSPGEPVSGDGSGCQLPPSLVDIGSSTTITLVDGAGSPIGTSNLTYDQGDLSSCTFTFDFPDVTAGEPFYRIELAGRGQLVYTEEELRAGVDITLGR